MITKPTKHFDKTPFSQWLREQQEKALPIKDGYVTTDIDFFWLNYLTMEFYS